MKAVGFLGLIFGLLAAGCGIPCWGPLPHGNAPVGVFVEDGIDVETVRAGMEMWNSQAGTQFVLNLETDYRVRVKKLDHKYYPNILGLATLYDKMEVWVEPKLGLPVPQTIAHELGHLLGLDHVSPTPTSPCNIMNPVHCGADALTDLDLDEYYSITDYCEKTTE